MTAEVRLYYSPLSPFCRKVRLALSEKKIAYSLVREDYWTKRKAFLLLNPDGRVPVLRIGERIFCDSQPICEYLEEAFPDPRLIPGDPIAGYRVRHLVGRYDEIFFREVTSPLLFERMLRRLQGRGSPDASNLTRGLKNLKIRLREIEESLEGSPWLAGDKLTLADFAASAQISCLDLLGDVEWSGLPATKAWYITLKSRPGFQSIVSESVGGCSPPAHYRLLDY